MTRELMIDGFRINDESDCYVIAEIGHNHQGDLEKAKELIRQAKAAGANAVKLQKRENRSLYTSAMYEKPYDHENSFGRTYGEHREFLEFGLEEYRELMAFSEELGITFFATAFDVPSADFLRKLNVPAFKIASGDLKNIPLIKHIARFGKPLVVSTGGGTMEDIERMVAAVLPINKQLAVLQCTANYPAPFEELNLRVIQTLRDRFPAVTIGWSGHDNGIAMGPVAYVLGARVIEKHFTLNRAMKGTDHAFSLEPVGLTKLVRDLRRARIAIGDGIKQPYPSEVQPLLKMGKKLVAAHGLAAGHTLAEADIAIKSPGDGIPPYELERVIGRTLKSALAADESLPGELLSQASPAVVTPIPRPR